MSEIPLGMPSFPPDMPTSSQFDFDELKSKGGIHRIGELNPYITLSCDLRCKYCYMGDFLQTAKNTTELMSREFFNTLVDSLVKDGDGLDRMTFLGGEPTLHPEITDMINDAADKDVAELRMTTNGVGLHYLDLSRLKPDSFECVSVSIDGTTSEENDNTRGRGSFKKILHTLGEYKEAGVPLSINYTVTTNNVAELNRVPDFFKQYGAQIINFHRASLNGTAYDNPDLIVGPEAWIAARDQLIDHVTANAREYEGMTFRIPYTFLSPAEMAEKGYVPIQENNYHSPDGGHRLIVLPPTPQGQGLCYMSSDLIGEPNSELGKISDGGVFTWNNDSRNELTAFHEAGSASPNISTEITGHDAAELARLGLVRVSHSFKATLKC